MINRDALKRILTLASEDAEMRHLVISLNGGFGGTKRKQAMDDPAHILVELEKQIATNDASSDDTAAQQHTSDRA